MVVRSTTTSGKVKLNIALRPEAYKQLVEMCCGPRSQGDFVSDLIMAEAERRLGPDLSERIHALEQQLAAHLASDQS